MFWNLLKYLYFYDHSADADVAVFTFCCCLNSVHHTAQRPQDLILGVTKKERTQSLSKAVSCLKLFSSLRAFGFAITSDLQGKSQQLSLLLDGICVCPSRAMNSEPHANSSIYLCSFSPPMTQKEIRWEADFMWACWLVKLTHSEHLMFFLSVK